MLLERGVGRLVDVSLLNLVICLWVIGGSSSIPNGTDVGILSGGKLVEPPELGNKCADDWQHIDTVSRW